MTDIPFDFPELTAQAREAATCAPLIWLPWSILEAWRLFHTDLPRFFRTLNAEPDSSLLYLFYYLQFTRFAYRKYQERKIPEDVFYHTFSGHRALGKRYVLNIPELTVWKSTSGCRFIFVCCLFALGWCSSSVSAPDLLSSIRDPKREILC